MAPASPPPPSAALRTLTQHGPSLLTAFAGMLALRGVLLLQSQGEGLSPWLLPADFAAAVFLLLALPWLARRVPVRIAVAGAIGLGYYAAGEHLYTHVSLFRLAHLAQAASPEFLAATVLSPRALLLPLYAAMAYVLLHLLLLWRPAVNGNVRVRTRVAAMLALLVAYYLAVPSPTLPGNNVLLSSLVQVPGAAWRSVPREAEPDLAAGNGTSDPAFFLREDAGRATDRRPNVLLILIEGLSGGYLPSVARHHGLDPDIELPGLDTLLDRHGFTVYRNPLALQRQTNRGTYPLLCGDYPKIVTAIPKMTVAASGEQALNCLPRLLRDQGYRTAYIQAAPLAYMNKNRFMPQAGFEHLVGRETFIERGIPAEGWGASDADFLALARTEIDRLQEHRPWFATLLNVGTHHPYQPAEDAGMRAMRQQAFSEMTDALAGFLDGLAADGGLADTWVIVTSDEAGGFRELGEHELVLDNNFGMLALRPPGRAPPPDLADRDAIVSQIDVPVTILDLLGLSDRGNMIGRSLLADGPLQTRGLLFGDTYRARSYFLYEDGRLTDCDETLMRCRQWRFDPERLFGSLRPDTADPPLALEERTALAADASVIRDLGIATADSYQLAPGPITAERPYRGGQYLRVSQDDTLELTLKGSVTTATPPAGGGHLRVVLREARSGKATIAVRRLRVEDASIERRLEINVAQDWAAISVDLYWEPDREGDSVALQELRLALQEAY